MRLKGLILGLLVMAVSLTAADVHFKVMVADDPVTFNEREWIQTYHDFKVKKKLADHHTTLKELYEQGWKVIQIKWMESSPYIDKDILDIKVLIFLDKK